MMMMMTIIIAKANTYTAFSELFGVGWRREIQAPRVSCMDVFPIDETFGGLTQPSAWLRQSHVKDFIHLRIVRRNVEDIIRLVLDTGHIHRNQVLGYTLPFYCTA